MAIKTFIIDNTKDASQIRADIVTLLSKTPDSVDRDDHVVKIDGDFTAADFVSIETSIIDV